MTKKIMGVTDIAKHFDVSSTIVYRWIKEGKIPANDLLLGKRTRLWSYDILSEIEKLREKKD